MKLGISFSRLNSRLRCNLCSSLRRMTYDHGLHNDSSQNHPNSPHASEVEEQIANELFDDIGASNRVRIDPDKTTALMFPGQGSQYVGMAKNLLQYPNVKNMFEVASEILGFNLLSLCLQGIKSELDKTIHCQPAVLVTSLAGVEKLQCKYPEVLENCFATAGFSVGEYAALVFSGALSFEDSIRLIKVRAQEMQNASDASGGGMISVIGGAKTKFNMACMEAEEYCRDKLEVDVVCKVSGYLSPNVRTIAGHRAALEYIADQKRKYSINKVQMLPVSGAFHTRLMYPAYSKLKTLLNSVEIQSPLIKVYSNVDGLPYRGPKDIANKLPAQIIKPVKWEQSMHNLFSRDHGLEMPNSYQLGPGQQLGSLLRRCNGKAWVKYLPVEDLG